MNWDLIFFWAVAGALTLAVVALLVMAMMRRASEASPGADFDVQVYRQQLEEVDRDIARGVLSEADAERLRVEISRRLLEADKSGRGAGVVGATPKTASRVGAGVMVAGIVAGSVGLYLAVGNPGLADLPLTKRLAESTHAMATRLTQAEMEAEIGQPFAPAPNVDPQLLDLIEQLRAKMVANPDELQGQIYLAQYESQIGNFKAAHRAMARVIALKGDAADALDYTAHMELMVFAANGYVSPEAEAAARKALVIEPRNGKARYMLGLLYIQYGRFDIALKDWWDPLLRESTAQAPWVRPILSQIDQVAEAAGIRYTPPRLPNAPGFADAPGPTADDVEAASEMTAEDRQEMIRGMVEGLAERLATEGGGPEEWARLINALGVLGEQERAATIWAEAQEVFAETPAALDIIRAAARNIGVAE